ncbi:ABC-2 type transport system permease protein [Bacillus pakistanensis]|uniref:ABC-2 type transport system permease protein n=1 Tax=Rossellomorea pakistanensis TaxID=992288 RepID=A0ABS2N6R1_9BACI|nr:ABC transporter permease subunit [Bacillus pakistanensis]MBM7583548.1 ABC-2 type transport system permease protein [Bacillus pakistanensis]
MINLPLFRSTMKRTSKLVVIFTILLTGYLLMTIGMYDPSGETDIFNALPESMREAFGMEAGLQGVESFLATGFYGVSYLLFMMIFCIIVGNQLLANLVDRGAMAYLLASPVSRKRMALTQAAVFISGLLIISILSTLAGIVGLQTMIEDVNSNMETFLQINVLAFLLFFAISGYAFFFSALFNEAKLALGASAGISIFFYLIQILSNSSDLDWLKYLTIFTAFQPLEIVKGSFDVWPVSIGLALSGLFFYTISVIIFSKRDLPL